MSEPAPVDPHSLDERRIAAFNVFQNVVRAEGDPTLPPRSIGETRAILLEGPTFVTFDRWWRHDEGGERLVAAAELQTMEVGDTNRHVAFFRIDVLPDLRRRGIGTDLLGMVAARAAERGRRLLVTHTEDLVPDGERFLEAMGARSVLSGMTNQLLVADLDRDLVRRWVAIGDGLSDEFEPVWWDGPVPEDEVEAVVALRRVMNDQPFDDLELEPFEFDADDLRQVEASIAARGIERWMLAIRARAEGRLAGYTEMLFNPNIPDLGQQGDTGVFPEFRGRGLGRWLKGAMAGRVLRERPGITRIWTENASSNAPMLRINTEMGFRPYKTGRSWQLTVDEAREAARRGSR